MAGVVFLDFMAYNPNVRFLTLVKVSVEFRPGGIAQPFVLLRSVDVGQILLSKERFASTQAWCGVVTNAGSF